MKKHLPYIIPLGVITLWGVFSCFYVGVEDGSSGLSMLGCIHVAFFLPGLLFMQVLKGSHSNADIPLMAIISWLFFSLLTIGVVIMVKLFGHTGNRGKKIG